MKSKSNTVQRAVNRKVHDLKKIAESTKDPIEKARLLEILKIAGTSGEPPTDPMNEGSASKPTPKPKLF